jgi:spore maturation protein SpmA
MAMHKYGDLIQNELQKEDFLIQLGDAAVRIDLLHVKPSHTVCLSLDTEINGSRETSSRGMIMFIIIQSFTVTIQLVWYIVHGELI